MGTDLVIQVIKSSVSIAIDISSNIIVGCTKSIDYVTHHLIFINRFSRSSQLRSKTLHLGEVSSRGEIVFLGTGECTPQLIELGPRAPTEHSCENCPQAGRGVYTDNMSYDFRREGL
jgi:hypothetical protein